MRCSHNPIHAEWGQKFGFNVRPYEAKICPRGQHGFEAMLHVTCYMLWVANDLKSSGTPRVNRLL